MPKTRILISGGGPAGLVAAILLDKTKYEVTLIEKGPRFMDMGFSIILWEAGYEILQKALAPEKSHHTHPINTFTIYGGQDIVPLQSADTTGVGYSIERDHLINELAEKFMKLLGEDSVRFNTTISDIVSNDETITVRLSGKHVEAYDLLIIADGMHSFTRTGIFKTTLESKPYKISYSWIKPGSNLHDEAIIGFMQNYTYLIQTVGNKSLLAYYYHTGEEANERFLQNLKEHIEAERGGTFDIDRDSTRTFMSEEVTVDCPYNNRIVLVGDAYHGHPPTLAMGTSMAMDDAWELTKKLNDVAGSEFTAQLPHLLKDYAHTRKSEIRRAYTVQDLIEKLIISDEEQKIRFAEYILKYGGWSIIEPMLRQLFSAKLKQ